MNFNIKLSEEQVLERQQNIARLKENELIQIFLKQNHLDASFVDENSGVLLQWLRSINTCRNCKGLDYCAQKIRGKATKLKIDDLFSCIIAREDVINLKPNSEAYLKALKTLEKNAFETIAIEDSKRGIVSALYAGLKVVKVDEYTTIKFSDNRCLEINSVDELVEKLIDNTSKTNL